MHALLSSFLASRAHQASARNTQRVAAQHLSTWTTVPTFAEIEAWHRAMASTPQQANKALAILKSCFTWSIRRSLYVGHNPATGIPRFPVQSRERLLSSQEVGILLSCLDMMPVQLAALLVVLLTTGCRLSEALSLSQRDIGVNGRWHLAMTKNGQGHTTFIPAQARALIAAHPERTYCFMGRGGNHWSVAGAEKAWRDIRASFGLSDVHLHDLRRTFATHLYQATKDEYLVRRCLNHRSRNVTSIYVRITEDEVATAIQAQADRFFVLTKEVHHATPLYPVLPLSPDPCRMRNRRHARTT